jgi:TatD DNase family protein
VIDTHAHLDALDDPSSEVLARARAAGVTRVVTVGTGIDSCRSALALAENEDGVSAALGIHPHDAGGDDARRMPELRELLEHPRAVAVGETGLDHYRDYAPRDAQRRLFEEHLSLADELGLPVVIHSRAASAEVAAALDGFRGPVIFHCFSDAEALPVALERGYYVSFAGNVTYRKAAALRSAAAEVAPDRILAETDCPYLPPELVRGRRNEPAFVVHTVDVLAAARATTPGELAAQIDANATAAFSLA